MDVQPQVVCEMEEIKGPVEAEARASEFIRGRHRGVTRTLFRRVERGRNTWLVEGEVWFKRALFLGLGGPSSFR